MSDVSETHRQEQLDIVLRLNKLTKRGKLSWERVRPQGEVVGMSRDAYVADWKGNRVIVEEPPVNASTGGGIAYESLNDASYRLRVRSRRADSDDEDRIVIPPMPAIDDLVATIQRVNDEPDRAKGDLDDLRDFKEQLDEEL